MICYSAHSLNQPENLCTWSVSHTPHCIVSLLTQWQRHAYIHVQLFVVSYLCSHPTVSCLCSHPTVSCLCSHPTVSYLCSCPNCCLQVVVAGDATFQDVKTEIVRVYQGISSTSPDERYAKSFCLISVMSEMLPYCEHEWSPSHTSLLETGLAAAMLVVALCADLISDAGVTGRWELLF